MPVSYNPFYISLKQLALMPADAFSSCPFQVVDGEVPLISIIFTFSYQHLYISILKKAISYLFAHFILVTWIKVLIVGKCMIACMVLERKIQMAEIEI